MPSTPDTSFGSGSCTNQQDKTNRLILPPSPSTGRSANDSDSDSGSHRDSHRNSHRDSHRDTDPGSVPGSVPDSDDDEATEATEATKAYQLIWDSFCGLPIPEAYPTCFLDQHAYDTLCEKISKHDGLLSYFDESIRKDWNANTGILTLRLMPSPMHEYFQDSLIDAIKKELDRIADEYPSLRPFRDSIKSCAHTDYGHSAGFTKSPDGQFSYDGISHPQFVVEIAYSEGEKQAMNKSCEYFTEIPGEVSAVLLVDIHYAPKTKRRAQRHSHSGSLSLWTSRKEDGVVTIQRTVNAAVFRDDDQASVGELVLPFELFMPPNQRHQLPVQDVALHLSYKMLSDFVTSAEQRQRLADATPPPPSPVNKITFVDEYGDIISEKIVAPGAKRRRGSHQLDLSARRTRSMSRPRRSTRLRRTGSNRGV